MSASTSFNTQTALLWVESIVGAGHLQVADQLAAAMMQTGLDVHVVSGSLARSPELTYGGATLHNYPEELRIFHDPVKGFVTAQNQPLSEHPYVLDARRCAFMQLVDDLRPGVLLTEHWPFGRGNLDNEIRASIQQVHEHYPETLIYASVRDIMLTAPGDSTCGDPSEAADTINRLFKSVFVHGDDTFVPFQLTFPQAELISPEKILHTGYLVHPMPPRLDIPDDQRPVLVSTGGGATLQGIQLYKTAILARASLPDGHELAGHPWVLMVSPAYPDEVLTELRGMADALGVEVTIRENLPADQFRCAISNSKLCVSLSGYNTVIETYAADVPAVLFPFQNAAQGQLYRANAFAALGKMVVFPQEEGGNPDKLIELMDEALAKQDIEQAPLKLRGDDIVAKKIQRDLDDLCSQRPRFTPRGVGADTFEPAPFSWAV